MKKLKGFINNKNLFLYAMLLYCCITIPTLINHYPWFDEFHALRLAQEMTTDNFVNILKSEGHFALWYLIIMPIAKLQGSYYIMLAINWIFYTAALVIMWKKAEFNNLIKCIITFSWISLYYFPIVARCYSIGILGLFIVLSLYKKQLEKPVAYALTLGLTAHTAFLNTIPLVPLGCIFIYKLIKNRNELSKKNIFLPFLILFIASFLWVYPFLNGYGDPNMLAANGAKYSILQCLFSSDLEKLIGIYAIALVMLFIKAKPEVKFVIVVILSIVTWFYSCIYTLYYHHALYFLVYFIMWLWLVPDLHELNKKNTFFIIIFSIIFFWNWNWKGNMKCVLNAPNKTFVIKYLQSLDNKQYLYVDLYHPDVAVYNGGKNGYIIKVIWPMGCVNSLSCVKDEISKQNYEKPWNVRVLSTEPLNESSYIVEQFYITEIKEQ